MNITHRSNVLLFCLSIVVSWGGDFLAAFPRAGETSEDSSEGILYFVPHTHWEGAVFKTREEYLDIGLPNILEALKLLERHPEYRFVLDQAAYVRPFLERYPEQRAAFQKFVDEGRLQIVGGVNTMLDVNMPSGESFIRHLLYSKGYYQKELGVDVRVGWQLDTFGHHAQMPQLLKSAGFQSYWFFRGVPGLDTPSEFLWEGIDGTRIPAFWLPHGYGSFYGSPASLDGFRRFFVDRYDQLKQFTKPIDGKFHIAGLAGADVSLPEDHVPVLVKEFNNQERAPFQIRFAVPTDYEQATSRSDPHVFRGELNPIFQGIYSSRIEVKQWMRRLEYLLTTAEKLGSLASWLGGSTAAGEVWRAWEPVLFNQAHDLASGVMVDKVYVDTIDGYKYSQRLVNETISMHLNQISSRIDTRGEGIPLVIFNMLGWSRTDIAEADVGFRENDVFGLRMVDPAGSDVPVQLLAAERYGSGGLKRAQIIFSARDIPGLGYSVYRVLPIREREAERDAPARADYSIGWAKSAAQRDEASMENDYYRLTFNLWTGEMTGLRLKASNWEVLDGPANVVAREQDGGDFWELYGNLHGARNIAMRKLHGPPHPAQADLSSEYVGGGGSIHGGPVFSEYRVSHPFDSGSFATRVRIYADIPRIDIRTTILNNDEFVRYRALFPTSIGRGTRIDEIAFGSLERPLGLELPAQNWIAYGDGNRGIALLNHALPGNNVWEDGTLMLSLARSARINAYAFHGGYEPGISSDTGLEIGKELTFDYALLPYEGSWSQAKVYRAGWEFNQPLLVHKVAAREGPLPTKWGWVDISAPNVVLSTLKPSRDGMAAFRIYEAGGEAASRVNVRFQGRVLAAHEGNLMEDPGSALEVSDNSIRVHLGPYKIKTILVEFAPHSSAR